MFALCEDHFLVCLFVLHGVLLKNCNPPSVFLLLSLLFFFPYVLLLAHNRDAFFFFSPEEGSIVVVIFFSVHAKNARSIFCTCVRFWHVSHSAILT